ncbi:zinc-binding alcohol dehydrogenase family protein [Burkholderiales bacterium JOSHI_001]|nr:zinc-binding alcohol dehydrogenase family protein [Burkholderiales bacterium JOSHI_001]
MKAVAYRQCLPISDANALQDMNLPAPQREPRDLLVEVKAVSVNPVDTKIRAGRAPAEGQVGVLGWDAAGVVRAVGAEVTLFKPGDRVWYAGAIDRPGSNSEIHAVDERIVGRMPARLGFAEAAAMPLTAITAWEMLFDRIGLPRGEAARGQTLLVIGAAGGVGSVMVQLARRLSAATVVGTASRPETAQWVRELGAHQVIDHSKPLADEVKRAGLPAPQYVVSLTQTAQHFAQIVELIAPQGRFGLIDDPAEGAIDVRALKRKSLSLHWELMFTRSLFHTDDMTEQHRLLNNVAQLVDDGVLRTTVGEHFGSINAANLKRAHAHLESGRARGKIVLEGF